MKGGDQGELFENGTPPGKGTTPWGTKITEEPYDLYGGRPPHEEPETSREAAKGMTGAAGHLQLIVLEAIRAAGADGMTDDEIEVKTGLRHQTASARRRELYLKGYIRYRRGATGEKTRRKTRSGRSAFVFVSKIPYNQQPSSDHESRHQA